MIMLRDPGSLFVLKTGSFTLDGGLQGTQSIGKAREIPFTDLVGEGALSKLVRMKTLECE